jgi:hypothetical protein
MSYPAFLLDRYETTEGLVEGIDLRPERPDPEVDVDDELYWLVEAAKDVRAKSSENLGKAALVGSSSSS